MKKQLYLLLAAVYMIFALTGCGSSMAQSPQTGGHGVGTDNGGKLSVVTTIFPEYDWVKNVLGEKASDADVTMLLDKGVDLHSYQPTTEDILKISNCDVFIYVGGESDGWVEDALKEAVNKDMVVINLLETLGNTVKDEEIVEGMEHDHDHEEAEAEDHDHEHEEAEAEDHDHEHEEGEEEHDHEHEKDEHVWLSLKNTETLVDAISKGLQKADDKNKDVYKKNGEAYIEKINELDKKYEEATKAAKVKTIVFGDRFPFRYLVDDYGLSYFAAFAGCSAETEASFETVTFLAKKVDELGLDTVMTIEGKDHRIAETIIENTSAKNQNVATMDSMQATTSDDVANGTTYLSVMEKNLDVLKGAID